MLPDWPDGTVTVLSTAAGAPHAIPVSTAVRSGDATIHFALEEGVRWHWTDEDAQRADAEIRAALRAR